MRLAERLALAHQRYEASRSQVERFREQILPHARESLRLIRVGYEQGDPKYNYVAQLAAQRTLAQAELSYVQALGEMGKAMADLAGLIQEGTNPGCPARPPVSAAAAPNTP